MCANSAVMDRRYAPGRVAVLTTIVLVAAFLGPPHAGAQTGAGITLVQRASATTGAGATLLTLAWPAPTEEGNLLVLAVHVLWSTAAGDIGVPPGWTLAERADNVGRRNITTALYYREGAPSQSGGVTIAASNHEDRIKMVLAEYRGIRATGSLDRHAGDTGESFSPTSGTTALTTDPEQLWLGVIANEAGFDQCDPTNGFAQVANATSGASTLGLYERVAVTRGFASVSVRLSFPCDRFDTFALEWAGVVTTFRPTTPAGPRGSAPIRLDQCRVSTSFGRGANRDRYSVRCRVMLDGTSDGIDPVGEGVRFLLTDRESPPCAGSCLHASVAPRRTRRCWRYTAGRHGPADVESLKLCEVDRRHGVYRLTAHSDRANLGCRSTGAPYTVGLAIGNDCSEACSTPTTLCPALDDFLPTGLCQENDPTYRTCPAAPLCSCVGGSCTPPVAGDGSCQAEASSSGGATFKCCDGATCDFAFSGSGGTCVTCGTETTCSIDLTGSGGALVDCTNAAQCDVAGVGSGDCRVDCGGNCRVSSPGFCCVTCANGPPVTCPDGSIVCARPCPARVEGWLPVAFHSRAVQTPCTGARYVRYLPTYGKWVGVALCSAMRYKIFLGDNPNGVFREIGDYAGHGQDHCELVNPGFRIPDEDDITSGGCAGCDLDSAHVFEPPVGSTGWSRSRYGEPFTFVSSWPMYTLYTAQWYECGVSVP